ncbi:MAG TPA: hypothetical protein VMU34_13335 [Mycobacterium sp.]|nr:hypothetical protein [Mycobacterium sp.]
MAPFTYPVPQLRSSARAVVGLIRNGPRRRQPARLAAGQDPTSQITSPHQAVVVAQALLAGVARRHVEDEFWRAVAAGPLAALLYAAAPTATAEVSAGSSRRWTTPIPPPLDRGWYRAAEICRAAAAQRPAAMSLERYVVRRGALSSRQQGAICSTMRAAI